MVDLDLGHHADEQQSKPLDYNPYFSFDNVPIQHRGKMIQSFAALIDKQLGVEGDDLPTVMEDFTSRFQHVTGLVRKYWRIQTA